MKTPGWGIFVGIMMILFGGCGALQDVQAIYSKKIMEMEGFKESMTYEADYDPADSLDRETDEIQDELEDEMEALDSKIEEDSKERANSEGMDSDSTSRRDRKEMPEKVRKMLNISDHYKTWIQRFGYIGMFFSLLYIITGVFMIVRQRFSLKLAYATLGSCILFALIQIFVLTMGEKNVLTMASSAAVGFGILIDIILLVIIAACDTEAYEPENFV